MGCCFSARESTPASALETYHKRVGPHLVDRDKKYYYTISFLSRPLYITLTSSKGNTDGYITGIDDRCPVEDAKNTVVLHSKIIYIDDVLVEGCDISFIANYLQTAALPMALTLAHPDGLQAGFEVPDVDPHTVVQMQPGSYN